MSTTATATTTQQQRQSWTQQESVAVIDACAKWIDEHHLQHFPTSLGFDEWRELYDMIVWPHPTDKKPDDLFVKIKNLRGGWVCVETQIEMLIFRYLKL